MADKFMYIPNDDTQNYPFCIFQLLVNDCTLNNKPTNENSMKARIVV